MQGVFGESFLTVGSSSIMWTQDSSNILERLK